LFLWGTPLLGQISVDCSTQSLQTAINSASSVDTIWVSGTCNENICIGGGLLFLRLDGGGSATITKVIQEQPKTRARILRKLLSLKRR
jgi:hypothetical protein